MSAKEFWDVLGAYGAQIWPAQLVFFIVVIVLVAWLFLKPSRLSNALVKLYFVFSFGWIGIYFFMIFYSRSAGLVHSYFLGSLFIIVALLFAVDIYRQKMVFSLPRANWQRWVTLILMLIALCYPLFSILFGHHFPKTIFPGTISCPTTALTLVLLTTALPRVDKVIYFILLFYSFTPTFSQIPKYGVYEDGVMLIIGIYSLIMLVTHWREKPALNS
jgi:hypothetical protein